MNILVNALPTALTVQDTEYPIRCSFRDCLRIMLAMEDNALTAQEKQYVLLRNLYVEMPLDVSAAMQAANWFLNGGESIAGDAGGPRLYSFARDANLIFAAFQQTHGINLTKTDLHWWEFLSLFMDLGKNTAFTQLVALRARVKTGKATKDEREAARKLGDMFDVPEVDDRSLEEREAHKRFMELIARGRSKHRG